MNGTGTPLMSAAYAFEGTPQAVGTGDLCCGCEGRLAAHEGVDLSGGPWHPSCAWRAAVDRASRLAHDAERSLRPGRYDVEREDPQRGMALAATAQAWAAIAQAIATGEGW